MTTFTKKIEAVANIAIIIVALLIGGVLAYRYFGTPSESKETIKAGAKVSLPDTDWTKNNRSLVLVLQKGCRYCTESAPFYQKLSAAVKAEGKTTLLAALPSSATESEGYLRELGVAVDVVKQVSPSSLGVRGTPALLLVDDKGIVVESWTGKLPADKETQVLNKVVCGDEKNC
jgi:thioredoxin-related protein